MKHKFEFLLLVGVGVLAIVFFLRGVGVSSSKAAPMPATPAVQTAEEAVLRAQLDTMRQFDQQLLATVYWALGGAFLLLLLVGGINWFTNYRLYERERDSLRQSAQLAAQQEASKLSVEFNELSRRLSDTLDARTSAFPDIAKRESQSATKAIGSQVIELRFEFTELLADYYEFKHDDFSALAALVEHLIAAKDRDWLDPFLISSKLEKIESLLAKKTTLTYTNKERLFYVLDKLKPSMQPQVTRLKKLADETRH